MKCRHCVNDAICEQQGSHLCKQHAYSRVCPNCKKEYQPVLGKRDPRDNRCIQDIYPNATNEEREQLTRLGICSDKCWDKYLGISPKGVDDSDTFTNDRPEDPRINPNDIATGPQAKEHFTPEEDEYYSKGRHLNGGSFDEEPTPDDQCGGCHKPISHCTC